MLRILVFTVVKRIRGWSWAMVYGDAGCVFEFLLLVLLNLRRRSEY